MCIAFLQSLGESVYSWLQELQGLLGQSTHWTDGKGSQRSSVCCAESSSCRGALECSQAGADSGSSGVVAPSGLAYAPSLIISPRGPHYFRLLSEGPTMCWGVCVYRCVHMHVLMGTCVYVFENVFKYV